MKSTSKNDILRNSLWLKTMLYITILFFLSLTLAILYWIIVIIMSEGFLGAAGVFVLLFFVGQISYAGLILFKHITTDVLHSKEGLQITTRNKTTEYLWADISKAKRHTIGGVLRLYNHKGKSIYAVQSYAFGYRSFYERVNEKIGISTVFI